MFNEYIALLKTILYSIWHCKIITVGANDICIGNIIIASTLAILTFRYSRIVIKKIKKYIAKKIPDDKDAANIIEQLVSSILLVLYAMFILRISNIPLDIFAFVGGALAIGIGFGGQNLMNNFMSSLILMIERSIKIGDIVKIDDTVGKVRVIGARAVVITSFTNVDIIIPSSKMVQNAVVNLTFADYIVHWHVAIKISKATHTETPEEIMDNILSSIKMIKNISGAYRPNIYLSGIDAKSYIYKLNFGFDISKRTVVESIYSEVNISMMSLLGDKDFEIQHLDPTPDIKTKDKDQSSK